jgi:hypothetical protein
MADCFPLSNQHVSHTSSKSWERTLGQEFHHTWSRISPHLVKNFTTLGKSHDGYVLMTDRPNSRFGRMFSTHNKPYSVLGERSTSLNTKNGYERQADDINPIPPSPDWSYPVTHCQQISAISASPAFDSRAHRVNHKSAKGLRKANIKV